MPMAYVFGGDDRMKEHERRLGYIAKSGLPVLIEGECGTGKEALAERLHDLSGTGNGFTRILCRHSGPVMHPSGGNGAVELNRIYEGVRGTVFLKNVHVLSPVVQEQFLTALEERDRETAELQPGVARLISSSTEPLDVLVSRHEFSAALYYRLSVYRIGLPPLRERLGDIPELFDVMLRRCVNGDSTARPVPSRMLDALMSYPWPGNLRELQNVARAFGVTGDADEIIGELNSRLLLKPAPIHVLHGNLSLKEQVKGAAQKLESEIILRTLERHRWNRRQTAQSLKISYRSLLYKMKNCNLRVEVQATTEGN